MSKQYDYLVFIGRFQPFHKGHQAVLNRAFEISENVIVLVGSTDQPRSNRNPFTFKERWNMISLSNGVEKMQGRLSVLPLQDMPYNEQEWVRSVQRTVNNEILVNTAGNTSQNTLHGMADKKVGLIGCSKDHTSYYLKLFPQWGNESVEFVDPINATDLRNTYFSTFTWHEISDFVPESTFEFLKAFELDNDFNVLIDEFSFVAGYKKQWEQAPYPPTFVCTDAVVVQSGHVLLVKRGASPGKGLWALPGGFLDQNERIEDGMIRELREETKIKVPASVLKGSIVDNKVFDDPNRSTRGRTITHGFLIKLPDNIKLPKVKGSDDAVKAKWMPLADVKSDLMYEDHYHIIHNLTNEL